MYNFKYIHYGCIVPNGIQCFAKRTTTGKCFGDYGGLTTQYTRK